MRIIISLALAACVLSGCTSPEEEPEITSVEIAVHVTDSLKIVGESPRRYGVVSDGPFYGDFPSGGLELRVWNPHMYEIYNSATGAGTFYASCVPTGGEGVVAENLTATFVALPVVSAAAWSWNFLSARLVFELGASPFEDPSFDHTKTYFDGTIHFACEE